MIVKLLDQKIEVEFVDELSGAYGDFQGHLLKIRLIRGLQKDVFLTSFIHELIHVKQHFFGHEMDEDQANQDALFWYGVLKSSRLLTRLWKAYTE